MLLLASTTEIVLAAAADSPLPLPSAWFCNRALAPVETDAESVETDAEPVDTDAEPVETDADAKAGSPLLTRLLFTPPTRPTAFRREGRPGSAGGLTRWPPSYTAGCNGSDCS